MASKQLGGHQVSRNDLVVAMSPNGKKTNQKKKKQNKKTLWPLSLQVLN
jgi:hypothetical protein